MPIVTADAIIAKYPVRTLLVGAPAEVDRESPDAHSGGPGTL